MRNPAFNKGEDSFLKCRGAKIAILDFFSLRTMKYNIHTYTGIKL